MPNRNNNRSNAQSPPIARAGQWTLLRNGYLGGGGNGSVWRATDGDGNHVAVKVLKANWGEPFQRFQNEVTILRRLGPHPGVLWRVADSLSPNDPPTGQPPHWLIMPRAFPIQKALGPHAELATIIRAVAAIADTLGSVSK